MSERSEAAIRLARGIAEGSIVTQATERLIYQIVEVCAEHEKTAVEAMRAKCEAIARREDDGAGTEADHRCHRIADAIAALKDKP